MPNKMIPAIQQRLKGDAESICFKCFHRKVCRAIDNQPCIECSQFTVANGIRLGEKQATSDESKWIPVTERLPHADEIVMTWSGETRDMELASSLEYFEADEVTHWMPLPQPPKGE